MKEIFETDRKSDDQKYDKKINKVLYSITFVKMAIVVVVSVILTFQGIEILNRTIDSFATQIKPQLLSEIVNLYINAITQEEYFSEIVHLDIWIPTFIFLLSQLLLLVSLRWINKNKHFILSIIVVIAVLLVNIFLFSKGYSILKLAYPFPFLFNFRNISILLLSSVQLALFGMLLYYKHRNGEIDVSLILTRKVAHACILFSSIVILMSQITISSGYAYLNSKANTLKNNTDINLVVKMDTDKKSYTLLLEIDAFNYSKTSKISINKINENGDIQKNYGTISADFSQEATEFVKKKMSSLQHEYIISPLIEKIISIVLICSVLILEFVNRNGTRKNKNIFTIIEISLITLLLFIMNIHTIIGNIAVTILLLGALIYLYNILKDYGVDKKIKSLISKN